MSREEDFKKIENGLRLLQVNFGRIVDKFQHLNQSVGYFGDELVIFKNNLGVINDLFGKLKTAQQEPQKTAAEEKKGRKKDVDG